MKKLSPFSGIKATSPAQQRKKLFYAKNRFDILISRFKKQKFFYYGLCIVAMFAIVQSACKKKETQTVPVVTITGINKTAVQIGDTLIISGGNFNATAGKNLVSVAAVAYRVINASPTQLTVIVPAGAQSGMLSVGFDEGQSTTFNQLITVAGTTQPYIKSISPAGAYEGDTVTIKGGNFATPYNYNSVTFNGAAGQIVNVSDSVIKVVLPNSAQTGPILITSNGLVSEPAQYNVSKVDPNVDGHICWLNLNYATNNSTQTEAIFSKGLTNATSPQAAMVYDYKAPLTNYITTYYPQIISPTLNQFLDNLVSSDSQNNAYYITVSATTFPAQYNLMRLNTASNTPPVSVWNLNVPAPVTTTIYKAKPTSANVLVNYTPVAQTSMDGNTIYIKMGITDDYYVGDVSANPVNLTLQHNVFGEPLAFKPQFTKDYIFYEVIGGSTPTGTGPNFIVQIKYMPRGSTTATAITLPFVLPPTNVNNEKIMCMQADPSHNNNLMIFTTGQDATSHVFVNVYKFNADTKQLTTLYSKANWSASGPASIGGQSGNTGFIWLGNHIYYSNNTQSTLFNTLYRLNDDGSSAHGKIYTVYGQLEQNGQSQAKKFYFFLGK